jgi:hypothetical protein
VLSLFRGPIRLRDVVVRGNSVAAALSEHVSVIHDIFRTDWSTRPYQKPPRFKLAGLLVRWPLVDMRRT